MRRDDTDSTWIGVDVDGGVLRSVLVTWQRDDLITISVDEAVMMGSTPHHLVARIALIAYDYSEDHRIAGLGVAFPGGVDRRSGTIDATPALPGQWQGLRVRDMLVGLTGLPTVIVNRADAVHAVPAGVAPAVGAALLARRAPTAGRDSPEPRHSSEA